MCVKYLFILFVTFFLSVTIAQQSSVDPWRFTQRLTLYKTMLNATTYEPLFGENNEGNILWGLPLQFIWQNTSGRLMEHSGEIFGKSWWGCMNYYLSAVPYLGAMKAGLVPNVTLLPPSDNSPDKFCLSPSGCNSTLLDKWSFFFTSVQNVQAGTTTNTTVEDLMTVLWEAHTSSIVYAMSIFVDELNYLESKQEQKFGVGWGYFVQIIAAAGFVTNSTEVQTLQGNLPFRMLSESDIPGEIKDFSKNMNIVCEAMFAIYDFHNSTAYKIFMYEWDNAMKNHACQLKAQEVINNFFNSPTKEVISMLISILDHCK